MNTATAANEATAPTSAAQIYYLRKGKRTGSITTLEIKENVAKALERKGLIELAFNDKLLAHYWKLTDAGRSYLEGGQR